MDIISSPQNQLIKETKKLQQRKYRESQKLFLIEGIRLAEEALKAKVAEKFFYSLEMLQTERGQTLLSNLQAQMPAKAIIEVSSNVLHTLAETETPQGIVGVARQQDSEICKLEPGNKSLLLIMDSLQEPGNLGTMLRTGWAAGVTAVICLPGTVDPYNGKTVRASMGGIFNVPVFSGISWDKVEQWCRQQGYQIVAGGLQGKDYYKVKYAQRVALVIGNEGKGLTQVQADEIDVEVTIPMTPKAESLNAAVAGGILLYEIIRSQTEDLI